MVYSIWHFTVVKLPYTGSYRVHSVVMGVHGAPMGEATRIRAFSFEAGCYQWSQGPLRGFIYDMKDIRILGKSVAMRYIAKDVSCGKAGIDCCVVMADVSTCGRRRQADGGGPGASRQTLQYCNVTTRFPGACDESGNTSTSTEKFDEKYD